MKKRIYHRFPHREVEFEQRNRYYADLPFLVKVMAGIDGKFGMFVTESVSRKGSRIQARREIEVEIVTNGLDFSRLNYRNVGSIIDTIEFQGTIDFRISLKYSYLDGKYDRVPLRGDIFLVRAILEEDILTLRINHVDGPGRTECGRIADTIIDELRRGS
ncbi:hypothetical protein [Methanohalophilus sp.]|uniref:hypothetical protein n=1 Tax=Methanohalophilus sp. TaxID=1966352 RepID=UPI002618F3DE|nr:hypothetical protein [Methanohalophilus sp.]MDK2892786.1 hypothetical protein [Methanohalophilus sp.]